MAWKRTVRSTIPRVAYVLACATCRMLVSGSGAAGGFVGLHMSGHTHRDWWRAGGVARRTILRVVCVVACATCWMHVWRSVGCRGLSGYVCPGMRNPADIPDWRRFGAGLRTSRMPWHAYLVGCGRWVVVSLEVCWVACVRAYASGLMVCGWGCPADYLAGCVCLGIRNLPDAGAGRPCGWWCCRVACVGTHTTCWMCGWVGLSGRLSCTLRMP